MTKSLLLIDDDQAFTSVLDRALERNGYRVRTVNRLEDVEAASTSDTYEYILLDLMLGEHSTLHLIRTLLERQPGASLVMLTGYASIPTTVRALKLGAKNYLAKPVGTHEVLAALEQSDLGVGGDRKEARPLPLRRLEWEHIQRVLDGHDGNISAAARSLRIHRRSLQRKLAKRPVRD